MTGSLIALKVARLAAAGLFSVAALGLVGGRAAEQPGSVVVHVTEPDVTLFIDDQAYEVVGRRFDPIARELDPGEHRLLLRRGGEVLFDQDFRVESGRESVLTAWRSR